MTLKTGLTEMIWLSRNNEVDFYGRLVPNKEINHEAQSGDVYCVYNS